MSAAVEFVKHPRTGQWVLDTECVCGAPADGLNPLGLCQRCYDKRGKS